MKKELLIASLMLTSPAALADTTKTNDSNLVELGLDSQQAQWVFDSNDFIRVPRYDFDNKSGTFVFSHNEVLQASIHFFPVDSKSNLFDFRLKNFDPLKAGDEEYEVAFKTKDISNNRSYFANSVTYYAVKKADTVYLFNCDSTKRCDADEKNASFAVLKIKEDDSIGFVHTASNFYTPYNFYDQITGEEKDLGLGLNYKLKK